MSNILHSQDGGDVLAHVAGNLRRLRAKAGLAQTTLAEKSGISRRMIVAVEGGDANISLSSLDRLAAALGVRFADLVRDPAHETRENIDEVTWRGGVTGSEARLLASAPAVAEAQMWLWSLGPGDRYDAEPDPAGWHEMLFVTGGVLTLELAGRTQDYPAGTFAVYSSAQPYAYLNRQAEPLIFVRNVVS